METTERGAYREFSIDSIFSDQIVVPEQKVIWKTRPKVKNGIADPSCEEMVQIVSGGINIVSSRDVRRNVRRSIAIGLDLAAEGQRVLYVNSYAGIGMLRESLSGELERVKQEGVGCFGAGTQSPAAPAPEAASAPPTASAPPRLPFKIVDCKMGMWSHCDTAIERALYNVRYEKVSYGDNSSVTGSNRIDEKCIDVLILNSYEFSAMYYRDKMSIATQLLNWVDKYKLTVIVFTQEVKTTMGPGIPMRGPLGLLTSTAVSVANIEVWVAPTTDEDGEEKTERRNSEEDGPVHEQIPPHNIKIFYSTGGNLHGAQYPKGYKGQRYPLSFWPRRITENIPEGIAASQVVGMPPMDD